MHSSFFNYHIQRPYPFLWFTPLALFGGITLLVLLSIMNFVQNSYALVVLYAGDPNSTITNGIWYQHWPSYLTSGVRPTCQPANLPVNTQFFTNQSGLMWTITNVFQSEDKSQALPSLPYLNNLLHGCNVSEIRMTYDNTQNDDALIQQHSPWDIEVRAFVTCGVHGPTGYTLVNVTAVYNALTPYTTPGVTAFVAENPTTRASMYWAEVVLKAYWIHAVDKVLTLSTQLYDDGGVKLSNGFVSLYPHRAQDNIMSGEFFDIQYNFLLDRPGYGFTGPLNSMAYYLGQTNTSANPHIWSSVDQLAKSMYSAVLADLGQTQDSARSSFVKDAATIQHFTSRIGDPLELALMDGTPAVLEKQDYDSRQSGPNPTGPLGLSPSVVSTKYLCQVPRLKPIGDIFVSVLLADIVFLQAAWKLYTFLVDKFLLGRRPSAMHCEGCLDDEQEADKALLRVGTSARQHSKGGIVTSTVSLPSGTISNSRYVAMRRA